MVNLDLPILNRVKNILTKTEKIDTDIASVLTKLSEQGVDIDSIIASIGTSGDQASAATLFGKLAGLASQSGGAVKSVQRGVANSVSVNGTNINISSVNPKKCIVIVNSSGYYIDKDGWSHMMSGCYIKSFTNTRLTLIRSETSVQGSGMYASWQVIEFN